MGSAGFFQEEEEIVAGFAGEEVSPQSAKVAELGFWVGVVHGMERKVPCEKWERFGMRIIYRKGAKVAKGRREKTLNHETEMKDQYLSVIYSSSQKAYLTWRS
jgi:hypothetical protein